jgi:hypothetical protein
MSEPSSPRIPWLRVFVEGVVIVVSVLLALGADAWWDGRQQRQHERNILVGLRGDLEATLQVIAPTRQGYERLSSTAERIISLGASAHDQLSAASMDTLLAQILLPGTAFTLVDATLSALLSSEGLEIISNLQLRAKLAEWPVLLASIRRDEGQNQTLIITQFLPYLYDRVPIRTLDAISSLGAGTPPSAFSRDARALLGDLRFENHVNDVLFYHRNLLRDVDALEDHIRSTLELVELELEDD